jgi:glucokinase
MSDLIALAVDMGGSHAACAVVRGGEILASRNVAADGGRPLAELLPRIAEAFRELLAAQEMAASACAGFVLGFCGIVSAAENRVLAVNGKFEDAPTLDLASWCRREFGIRFYLENDARLALLGESAVGAARGASDAVMVTLGSGIGGAAMLGGRLIESRNGLAGTIGGHLPVVLGGRRCSCGNLGCAEAEASTSVLREVYSAQPGSGNGALAGSEAIGFAELFEAVDAGDRAARSALDHCLKVWSALTVSLIHAYDPEVVVYGGAVMKRGADILPRLQQYVQAHAWTPGRVVPLRAASLGSDAALLGAIPLMERSRS